MGTGIRGRILSKDNDEAAGKDVYDPHEVVERSVLENITLIKAWREHLGLTREEVAARGA